MNRIRHSQNKNLSLHYQSFFNGYPVQVEHYPYISDYLERTKQVIDASLQQYGRVFAFRIDLRFPSEAYFPIVDSNTVIDRFFASLKAKIRHNRNRAKDNCTYAHDTIVRYVWCREIGQHGAPHYHVAILLNYNAFCSLGKFEIDRNNLFNRVLEAWASAIGLSTHSAFGLVHFPENPFYILRRDAPLGISSFFYRVSYLSKAATKQYGNGVHGFGCSRI